MKKYYVKRWKRTFILIKNIKIARLKFVSKFILHWRHAIIISKKDKLRFAYNVFNFISQIKNKKDFLLRKYFFKMLINYNKLLDKYLKIENDINLLNWKKEFRNKNMVFNIIKNNFRIAYFNKRRKWIKKFFAFKLLRNYCENHMQSKIKKIGLNNKLHQFRKKNLKRRIQLAILFWLDSKRKISYKIKHFRNTFLKIKIFKFLKHFKTTNKINANNLVKKFRNFFLKDKFFQLLKIYMLILYRENKIINKLTKMYKIKRKKLIRKYINSWKSYLKCQRFRKVKRLKLLTKIFYGMKFALNKF